MYHIEFFGVIFSLTL